MKRILFVVFLILIIPVTASAQSPTVVVGCKNPIGCLPARMTITNNTSSYLQIDSITLAWDAGAELVQIDSQTTTIWGGSDADGSHTETVSDYLAPGDSVYYDFEFALNDYPTGVSGSVTSTVLPTPTATPTATNTPIPTATATPTSTPTGTVTPQPTATYTPSVTPTPTTPATPTPTPTNTPNVVLQTYNSVQAIVPVWTPGPTPAISLEIPVININQASGIAISVYKLLEQWHIFSTLLIVLIAISFLRWIYKFSTRRDAPDPENYIDADYEEIKKAYNRKRRF